MNKSQFWDKYLGSNDAQLYKKLVKYTKYKKGHLIWTGAVSTHGHPKMKLYLDPYEVSVCKFLSLYLDGHPYINTKSSAVFKTCKIKRCVNPNHIVLIKHGEKWISDGDWKTLHDLTKEYPLNFLAREYDISNYRLRKIRDENEDK